MDGWLILKYLCGWLRGVGGYGCSVSRPWRLVSTTVSPNEWCLGKTHDSAPPSLFFDEMETCMHECGKLRLLS